MTHHNKRFPIDITPLSSLFKIVRATTTSSDPTAKMSNSESTIVLKSGDGESFTVEVEVAMVSKLLKRMFEDLGVELNKAEKAEEEEEENEVIPITNVDGKVLQKVLEWCKHYKSEAAQMAAELEDDPSPKQSALSDWDKKYFDVPHLELFEIVKAANYMEIPGLMDFTCRAIANMIKKKSVKELREAFNIPDAQKMEVDQVPASEQNDAEIANEGRSNNRVGSV